MSQDVEHHCGQCNKCNASKPLVSQHAPMTSVPISKPWQMVVADVLEVQVSSNNNRYLLVVQDYFTIWVEVVSMLDQTATHIISALTKILGIPEVFHSNQGHNFESFVPTETLKAFETNKSCITAYHPQGNGLVERFNRLLLQMLWSYIETKEE